MRLLIVLSFLIAACGTSAPNVVDDAGVPEDTVQKPSMPRHLVYKPKDDGPILDGVKLRCMLPDGIYFVTGFTDVESCNVSGLEPEATIKTLWVVGERLPCGEEIVKVYYVDTLNLYTGEECPTTIVDSIYTTSRSRFIMDREVTVKCQEGRCHFSMLFFAHRPDDI